MKHLLFIATLALLVSACSSPAPEEAPLTTTTDTIPKAELQVWAGFYADTVPCADCPGIITRLHLKADSTYILTDEYLERDTVPYGQIGSWSVAANTLTLQTSDVPRLWTLDGERLNPLDQEGKPIDSPLSYSIVRVDSFPAGPMHLTGNYVYYADSHSITPDGSRFAIPVAMDAAGVKGAGLELEKLYAKQVKTPPDPLAVRIIATLRTGPAMEGSGTEQYIHVERVEGEVGK
ncbi:MAG: copper resistance protein NlpE N-terminal domain-containing protein [Flavobacteriales bacterium]|nr:copper resistance protein NlpE N-terminal domain-containing protein [Flavobacteriales bacterium]MBP9080249.1 copper resistance protein NlpE N-terminal domain-containing protein [Flavobacteriales bacterium]